MSSSSSGTASDYNVTTTSSSCNYSTDPCDFVNKGWSDGGVFSVLELNLVGAVVIFFIYSFLQSRDSNRALYQPRAQEDNPCSEKALPSYKTDHVPRCAPRLDGWFAWATAALKNVSDEEILVRSGLEAMLFVRFQRTIVRLLFKVAILAGAVLIPINSTGDQNYALARVLPGKSYSSGFNDWMVTNLADNDSKLWAHLAVFVVTTLLLYQAYDHMMTDLAEQRILYLKYKVGAPSARKKDDSEHKENHEMTHTVLLSGLPVELRDAEALADHIDTYLYPEALVEPGGVLLIYHKPRWRELLTQEAALQKELIHHRNVLRKLEAENKPLIRPLKRLSGTGCCKAKVDAINHCEVELKKIRDELTTEDTKETHPTTGYAFVNFKSEVIAKAMVQNTYFKTGPTSIEAPAGRLYSAGTSGFADRLLHLDKTLQRGGSMLVPGSVANGLGLEKARPIPMLPPTHWMARRSPPTDDIIWQNLYMTSRARTVRYILFSACTWFLILFSAIPIGFLGSLSSLASIPLIGSAFDSLQSLPAMLLDAITAYLPVIVLILFQVFLPDLMCYFARGEGLITQSDVEAQSMTSLFTFFFFSTLLTSIIAGGTQKIVDIVDAIAGDPFGQVMALLVAITSPESGLFCALLLQGAGIGCALLLLRIGPYVGRRVKLQLAVTEDEIHEANLIEKLVFFTDYPIMLLNLTISLFFSLTLPITTVFGFMFFCVKYFITRHNVSYVYSNGLESGGKLFATAIRILIVIQAAFQLATVGMFGGKLATAQFGIALAFFLYTLIQYPGLNRRLNAVFLQDDWIPDIDLTPDEKADRVRRKQQKEATEKQRRIEEILREKSLLEGDEMIVVISKSERQAAGHMRRQSGGVPASARGDANMAHAALFHQSHRTPVGDDDDGEDAKRGDHTNDTAVTSISVHHGDGDGGVPLHGDQLGNIDMDAAAALGIQMTSPRQQRLALTTRSTPRKDGTIPATASASGASSSATPDAASKGTLPAAGTFVTIDLHDTGAVTGSGASSPDGATPGTSSSLKKRKGKKIIKKKKKTVSSIDHPGLSASPRRGEHEQVGAEMNQLSRANSGIPIDSRARATVASTSSSSSRRHRSPPSRSGRRSKTGDDDDDHKAAIPATPTDGNGDKESEKEKDNKSVPRSRTRCECGPIHIDSQYER